MGWATQTLAQLVETARRSFRSYLPGSDAWLWPNNIYVTAKVKGALVKFGIDYADYIARQAFVHRADEAGIEAHGAEWGIARNPASPASGIVIAAGASGGLAVADGAVLQRSDGVQFTVVRGANIAESTSASLTVVAAKPGKASQTDSGTPLTAFSGVTGSGGFAVDENGLDGGRDVESYESWRQRIWWRKRYTPAGGAPADFVAWAREVPGVTRVYIERRWLGAGTLRIIPYLDDDRLNGIPTAADLARVQDHIDSKYSCGTIVVAAPIVVPIDITIAALSPNNADTQTEILAELRAAFRRYGRPAGNDPGHPDFDFLMVPTSFSLSWINEAVSSAANEVRHVLASPSADVALSSGQAPVLGTVTYV